MEENRIVYVDQIITEFFVKYNRMSELIMSTYAGSDATEINLFIDLHSVFKKIYSIDQFSFRYKDKYDIAAGILNMCAHYRSYFRSIGVYAKIYLVYGINCPVVNNSFVKDYNSLFVTQYIKKKDISNLIFENLEVIEMLCSYLPGIYFVDGGTNEVAAVIDYVIKKVCYNKHMENIIITKDVLALQLIPEHDVRILRPVKAEGDLSFIVDNKNLWHVYCTSYGDAKDPKYCISNTFFQNVLAMTKVKERNLRSMVSITRAFNYIHVASNSGLIDPTKFYTQAALNSVLLDADINGPVLDARFKAISTQYQSTYIVTMEKPDLKTLRLPDMEDPMSVKEIVSKYFYNNPIDLDRMV